MYNIVSSELCDVVIANVEFNNGEIFQTELLNIHFFFRVLYLIIYITWASPFFFKIALSITPYTLTKI